MAWWAWIVIGAILLGAELAIVDAQFYLVFMGLAALLVGVLDLAGIHLPEWSQWLIFAALAVMSMVFFRKKVYALLRKPLGQLASGPSGEEVLVPIDLAPGASCRLEYRGSTWTAQNTSERTLAADSNARIVNVDGLTLQIGPS
jgi:inner membrane protein